MQHESVPVEPDVSGLVPFGIGQLTAVGAPRPPSMDGTTYTVATTVQTGVDGVMLNDGDTKDRSD